VWLPADDALYSAFYHWLVQPAILETNPMERLDPIAQVE